MEEGRLEEINAYLLNLLIENKGDREKTIDEGITIDLFTKSEALEIINNTILSDEERKLAQLYFIDKKTKEEIAVATFHDRRTVRTQIKALFKKLKKTLLRMLKAKNIRPLF